MVMVTVGGTPPPPDGTRTLSFGVSSDQEGPFQSDAGDNITSATDERVLNVSAGSTFYAQVMYSGPAPVTGVTIYLANSSPAGFRSDLVPGTAVNGFTLNEPVGGCATDGTQTSVTCTYPITVAAGTPNITGLEGSGSEFAYVFRTRIMDTSGGDPYDQPPRGYVTVGSGGGTPTPPTPPTPPPTPPTPPTPGNQDPVAAFTSNQTAADTTGVTYKFSALESTDPDGDTLTYAWDFGDGSSATNRDFTKKYTSSGSYEVTLTVEDGEGGSDTEEKTLDVTVPGGPTPPITYDLTVEQTGDGNVTVNPKGADCGTACNTYVDGTEVTLTAVPEMGSSFSGWGGACADAGTSKTCTLKMDNTKNVVATFSAAPTTPTTYKLEVSQPGSGSGNVRLSPKGKNCGLACTIYPAGEVVTLTAVANEVRCLKTGVVLAARQVQPRLVS